MRFLKRQLDIRCMCDQTLLKEQYLEYILYLALPLNTYTSFFATQLAQTIISNRQLKLIVYQPQQKVIDRWLN